MQEQKNLQVESHAGTAMETEIESGNLHMYPCHGNLKASSARFVFLLFMASVTVIPVLLNIFL